MSNPQGKPSAIIVGHQGQDGQLLARLLISRNYNVIGVGRLEAHWLGTNAPARKMDIADFTAVHELVATLMPREIYYLAAAHASSEGAGEGGVHAQYVQFHAANQLGILNFLEAIRVASPSTRLFFASSCLIYGSRPAVAIQDESTPCRPDEPYGWAKCIASEMCAAYRARHGVKASVGILYNHESPLRKPGFFSRKVADGVRRALLDPAARICVGDLEAINDWGHAADFVEAFTRILKLDVPDDFIVATGEGHTVREFIQAAYASKGLDWKNHVDVDPGLLKRKKSGHVGNPGKLMKATGWTPKTRLKELVAILVEANLDSDARPSKLQP